MDNITINYPVYDYYSFDNFTTKVPTFDWDLPLLVAPTIRDPVDGLHVNTAWETVQKDRLPNPESVTLKPDYVPVELQYAVIGVFVITGVIGMLLNGVVVLISITKNIKNDYRYFVLNLGIVDLFYSATAIGFGLMFVDVKYDGTLCKIFGATFWYGFTGLGFALLPTVFNRYSVFYHNTVVYNNYFRKHRIALYCLFVDIFPLIEILPYGTILGTFGRNIESSTCTFTLYVRTARYHARAYSMTIVLALVAVYACIFFFGFRVHQKIRFKLQLEKDLKQKDVESINHTRRLVYATLAQAVVPLVLQLPFLLQNTLKFFVDDIPKPLNVASLALYMLNPSADALLTLFILKPYRKTLQKGLKVFKKSNEVKDAAPQVNVK